MQQSFKARLAALEALALPNAAAVDYGADALTSDEIAEVYGALEDGELTLYRGVLMDDTNMYLSTAAPGAGAWLNVAVAKADRAMVRYRRVAGQHVAQTPVEWMRWLEERYETV